jgi:hypothetical protein
MFPSHDHTNSSHNYNATIPYNCLFNDNVTLQLRYSALTPFAGTAQSYGECYNSTDWQRFTKLITSSAGNCANSTTTNTWNFTKDGDWSSSLGVYSSTWNEWVWPTNHTHCGGAWTDSRVIWTGNYTVNFTVRDTTDMSEVDATCVDNNGTIITSPQYLNNPNVSLTCTATGYEPLQTALWGIGGNNQNLTMTPYNVTIWFEQYNDTLINTTGYWADEDGVTRFNDNNITISIPTLVGNYSTVYFGYNQTLMEYLQFYEIDNDIITTTTENLTLIESPVITTYIKVIDIHGNPINDALVRIAMSDPSTHTSGS